MKNNKKPTINKLIVGFSIVNNKFNQQLITQNWSTTTANFTIYILQF